MIDKPGRTKTILRLLFFCLVFSFASEGFAQNGQTLFSQNCASCHNPFKRSTGPALKGVTKRGPWGDKKNLHDWVHNPAAFMAKDAYTNQLKGEYGGVMMQAFPSLTNEEIDAIIK